MPFEENTNVRHSVFGRGSVIHDRGDSIVVHFEHGIEACLPTDLELLLDLRDRGQAKFDPAVNVVTRILGKCIKSVNDTWGVFSSSRIALLPHQLWVCKRVLESWPIRWLVADDVGLGKTIEAGLILTPLLSSGRVRRLLILAPASLVEQWQVRLRQMFDIRLATYAPASDTPTSDYWNTSSKVVASIHTLRMDHSGRWTRLLNASPWDMIMIDEAHHMNVEERQGPTLSFQLLELLQERGRIHSIVLFTGTPHRGKDFGFLSLLRLLRPNEFDPHQTLEKQITKLRDVMIRNNKQGATDMQGDPIFSPVHIHMEAYSYSPAEQHFYDMLTTFITTGKAYAAGLIQRKQRTAYFVLTTMQKLASSSIAAVRRALVKRATRLKDTENKLDQSTRDQERLAELLREDDSANLDEISWLEERIAENLDKLAGISLNEDEIPALQKLVDAADAISAETKIEHIMDVVEQRFEGRSVLFFTEYKATQALLMSALQACYGDGCVTFINGDGFIDGVKNRAGVETTLTQTRQNAAHRFNRGEVRFLVSTEAAGEGIDLQENCSTLIHVDLPWNPMRLHQRVGRLSRYGQSSPVDVVTVRNPETVESKIWDCLDEKLDRITLAFQGGMEDPEDMRQLVLGMASPRMYTRVFGDADPSLRSPRLEDWFDTETSTFGGEDAVRTVQRMIGNVARFDFGEVADQIPRVDLPDLIPFFKSLLAMLGKRPNLIDDVRITFRTPEEWLSTDFAIADRYQLLFSRSDRPQDNEDIGGVGLKVVDRALHVAIDTNDTLAALGGLDGPLVVFALRDRITGGSTVVRNVIVGLHRKQDTSWTALRDWEVLKLLNPIADRPRSTAFDSVALMEYDIREIVLSAEQSLKSCLSELDLSFRVPDLEQIACLVPGHARPT